MKIKTTIAASLTALALMGTSAFAADIIRKAPPKLVAPPPPPCDLAFGGGIQSDYNFRGISQTDRGPGVWAYVEPRCKIIPEVEFYVGVWGWSTKLPSQPTGEFDFYGGIRPTIGPLAFDFGAMYYFYPKERQQWILSDLAGTALGVTDVFTANPLTLSNTDFWEVYGKVTWTATDWLAIGAYVYYTPSFLNSGAEATYAGGSVKATLPSAWFPSDWGAYISGEAAYYWLGVADNFMPFVLPFDLPNYTYWNAGFGFTYKVFTVDFRYHDTDLSREDCFVLTGDPRGVPSATSRWCDATFIAKLSFDLSVLGNLK